MTKENFDSKLKLAGFATNFHNANFIKKTDLDEKLRNINNRVTSHKTKQLDVDKKLKDQKLLAEN